MPNERWLGQLTKLNKARDNAPHKPLLLLVFLELVDYGDFCGGNLTLPPGLAYRFDTFFEIVKYRRSARPDIRMPFHHLSTQGFWSPHTASGELSKHRATTAYVVPDPAFLDACRDAAFRQQARRVLIATHFEPAERNALYHLVGIEVPKVDELAHDACFVVPHDAEIFGRSVRFRVDVVSAYNYTCALTGYRVTTISSDAIVDAAHIHQFSDSRNNGPQNRIALCKNAHWQFDMGLWTIDDNYRVIVATEAFAESSPNQKPLADMNWQRLVLPQNEAIWSAKTHLAWQRTHRFVRR